MKFGLKNNEIDLIKKVFEERPEVDRVFIYGSRAKNNYKKISDIDLAVRFKKGKKDSLNKIKSDLDDLPLIYNIDVLDESNLKKSNFKTQYEKTKKLFY